MGIYCARCRSRFAIRGSSLLRKMITGCTSTLEASKKRGTSTSTYREPSPAARIEARIINHNIQSSGRALRSRQIKFCSALIREAAPLPTELFCYQESDLLRLQLLVTESRRPQTDDHHDFGQKDLMPALLAADFIHQVTPHNQKGQSEVPSYHSERVLTPERRLESLSSAL
jgi:hypothetical protein